VSKYFDLVFDIPTDQSFTYQIDEKEKATIGKRAMVPFGRRECLGYIIAERDSPPEGVSEEAVKKIRRVVDEETIFDNHNIELAKWMAGYYLCSTGQALSAMIPSAKKVTYPQIPDDDDENALPSLSISDEQADALAAITSPADSAASTAFPSMFYLYGVTGSGKRKCLSAARNLCWMLGKRLFILCRKFRLRIRQRR